MRHREGGPQRDEQDNNRFQEIESWLADAALQKRLKHRSMNGVYSSKVFVATEEGRMVTRQVRLMPSSLGLGEEDEATILTIEDQYNDQRMTSMDPGAAHILIHNIDKRYQQDLSRLGGVVVGGEEFGSIKAAFGAYPRVFTYAERSSRTYELLHRQRLALVFYAVQSIVTVGRGLRIESDRLSLGTDCQPDDTSNIEGPELLQPTDEDYSRIYTSLKNFR